MDKSSSRMVEITVLSAEGLCINGKYVKKQAFAVVRVDAFDYKATNTDALGGSYPSWDEKLVINLPRNASFLTLEVQCKAASENRLIGSAKLPVSDFIGGYAPDDYLRFLSYILRDARGNKTGIINVSVRLKMPEYACSSSSSLPRISKVSGYQCSSQQKMGVPISRNQFDGVVTGIPAWSLNHV